VTRDEFGGYCCKKWAAGDECEDDDICNLLGIDVEAKALELVQDDILSKKLQRVPFQAIP
jgi:hypothetical protein